jgi:hypothetical protein
MYSLRQYILWIVPALLCAGCSGSVGTNPPPPQPLPSPGPPFIAEHGTLAVLDVANPKARQIRLFHPGSTREFATIVSPGERYHPNSLAFDRRGHLYIGTNDTEGLGEYTVSEFRVRDLERIREIGNLPRWSHSSVATDDQNYLYVNTPAFLGGDIKIYSPNVDRKPFLEIKDLGAPITTLPAPNLLWVASQTIHGSFLDGYEVRSRKGKFSHSLGGVNAGKIVVNADGDGSLAAVFSQRPLSPNFMVAVYSQKTGFLKKIAEGRNLKAMAGDNANTIYVSESSPGKVLRCDWQHCRDYLTTNSNEPVALAVNLRNRNLYVANRDAGNVQIYRVGETIPFLTIAPSKFEPTALAVEP